MDEITYILFSDYVLSCFQNFSSKLVHLKKNVWSEGFNVAEKRIIGGLRHMKLSHFQSSIGGGRYNNTPPVEDAISQRWCFYVMSEFENLYVSPQNRTLSKKGRVDFLFNGREKIAIEVALNGTQAVYNEKLDKFLSEDGVYKEWQDSFAIFNIVTDSDSRKVRDNIPEDRLKYLYEFNVETNTLYRCDMEEPL